MRRAVTRLLAGEASVEILREAENFSQGIFLAMALKPDVVLLDLHLNG
jgi:chemotaxis response regulator CheB